MCLSVNISECLPLLLSGVIGNFLFIDFCHLLDHFFLALKNLPLLVSCFFAGFFLSSFFFFLLSVFIQDKISFTDLLFNVAFIKKAKRN